MTNQTVQFREMLYQLRMDYGTPTDVYRIITADTDVNGIRSWTRKRFYVPKGILLPLMLVRKFFYDLSFIAANKNFTYGGNIDLKQRTLILDQTELPRDFEITTEDMIVCNMTRYAVKDALDLDFKLGYLLSLTNLVGSQPYQDLSIRVGNPMPIYQGASIE